MATKFDAVAGSELRDTQGEILSVEGADISELEAGRGIINDNHSNKLPDVIGRITGAKKIFGIQDCESDRQKYYWNKIKAPYIYTEGVLFDDEDHRSAKAAAAILKHQHRTDSPLKLKCSVEGGIVERGKKDERILARTKIRGLALTFTPANNATLVEGLELAKSSGTVVEDMELIKSLVPAAVADVPTLVDFSRRISVAKIRENIEKIHEVVGALKKNISLAEPLEKASKKQLLQQLGSDPQAVEISDWLSKDVKRDDVQQWFLRNYKKDPKIWNSQNKEAVQHYIGTAGTNPDDEIGRIRFDKSHSFEDGMKLWKDAEDSLKNKKKDASNLLKPDDKTKKLIDLGNGWGWYDLGKGYDEAEGSAMAHCGNINAKDKEHEEDHPNHHDRILSLRKEHNIDGETYHEPRLSFIENNGYIGESKGFGNSKPAEKYHDAIIQLLRHPRIKENIGGGYAPNNNFYLNDLPKDKLDKLLKDKPGIEKLWKLSSGEVDPNQYPKKHIEEALSHNQAFKDLKDGNPDMSQARFRDIDPKYAKGLISDFIRNPEHYNYPLRNDILNMMNSPHLDASHVDLAFSGNNKKLLPYLLSSHAATKDHIYRAFDDEDPEIRKAAVHSPRFGKEHMNRALSDDDEWVREAAVRSPHFGKEHMDNALKDKSEWVRVEAVRSPHFGKEHMDRALSDRHSSIRIAAVRSPHFGKEHMDMALNDVDPEIREAAVRSPHFGKEHMDKAFNDVDYVVRRAAIQSPHFGKEHMDRALSDRNASVRQAAVESSHFGKEHMDNALKDKSEWVRRAAIQSPHFGKEHMDRALSDGYGWVREAAVKSPHFGKEHFDRAFNDRSENVRQAAVESLHFGKEHFDKAFNDVDSGVRKAVVRSPHFGLEHMDKALKDDSEWVRKEAVQSPHFGLEHMDRALKDKSGWVREAAMESPHYQTYLKQKGLAKSTHTQTLKKDAAEKLGFTDVPKQDLMPEHSAPDQEVQYSKLYKMIKALSAGYGGAGSPTNLTGGGVFQTESVEGSRSFKYIDCPNCGKEQPYMKYQVKCRSCGKSLPFDTLAKFFLSNK